MRWMLPILAACGASTTPAPTTSPTTTGTATTTALVAPTKPDPGPACDAVANHVVRIVVTEKAAQGNYWTEAQSTAMTDVIRTRCDTDRWSGDVRTCMEGIENRKAAKACFEKLTPEQQEAMKRDEKAAKQRVEP